MITIGADPELFIINEKTNDVVSSIGLIPGEKGKPFEPKGYKKGFGIETDNILAEFNIPPASSADEFVNNITLMKNYINDYVKNINPDLGIQCIASRMVNKDQLQSKEAKLFGCDPDYNAYTEDVNPRPEGAKTNLRSAGFHVHVGYDNKNVRRSLKIVKMLDIFLGVPSVLLDKDTKRRSLYGKAGSFRLQPWGVEYRVLSSFMMSTPELTRFVYDQTFAAVRSGELFLNGIGNRVDIQKIINENDTETAQHVCDLLGFMLPNVKND